MFVRNKFFSKKARLFWLFGFYAAVFCFLAGPVFVFAQEEKNTIKDNLRKEIEAAENNIKEYQAAIDSKKGEAQTLSGEIKIIDTEIKIIESEIKKTDLSIKKAELEIETREIELSKIESFFSQQKILLRESLREMQKSDNYSLLEIIIEKNKFSDFFSEVQNVQNIHNRLQSAFEEFRDSKKKLEVEKEAYEEEKQDQLSFKTIKNIQEKDLKEKIEGRKRILKITNGEEKKYQDMLKSAKKDVTEIKKQLFMLEGMAITFEEALLHAKFASDKTGVRSALLLSVLTIETKLGTDLGRGSWKVDMKVEDRNAFKQICEKLSLDPDLMPVSRKPSYGWGGAMGPGQFLPRTWLVYENEVARLTGNNPPNPWSLKDAFVATALKLKAGGADKKTYEGERSSVLKFFAGSRWNNPSYSWYGEKVMTQAEIYQRQIDILDKSR